jgi:hypothetical protein
MRLKSELYKKEQEKICDKIIEILELSENNTITLYELDNDKEKQEKIIELIPYIRKYFSFNNMKAVGEPRRIKRPWLSIIKQIIKLKYTISKKDYRIKVDDKIIRSINYSFSLNI